MTFEKRGPMHHPKHLVSTLWLISSLTLLALVVAAPLRTSRSVAISPGPGCLCRDFALTPNQPTAALTAATGTDAVFQVNALPAEDEEQDRADAWDKPRASFSIPCSFRKVSDRRLIARRSILPSYPLRC